MDLCDYISESIFVKKLGTGAFGSVDLYQGPDNRNIAIKKQSTKALPIIIREINSLTVLQECPNVVRLIGVCFKLNYVYMVMEAYDGPIAEIYELDKETITTDMSSAFICMRKHGLQHNDISSHNIFYRMTPNGITYFLGDFGVSQYETTIPGERSFDAEEVDFITGYKVEYPTTNINFTRDDLERSLINRIQPETDIEHDAILYIVDVMFGSNKNMLDNPELMQVVFNIMTKLQGKVVDM